MNYLYFCLSFLFCATVCCLVFLFCVRVIFLEKVAKLDPAHVVNTPKKITALKKIKRDDVINALLENG